MVKRAVVSQFFRGKSGYPILNSVTVISEEVSRHDGKTYLARYEYDIEWSRCCDCYLFHKSGSGGSDDVEVSGLYHVTGDVEVKQSPCEWVSSRDREPWRGRATRLVRKLNRTRRLNLPPRHIQLREELEGIEIEAVWCNECRDWVRGDYLCEHCWWCDKTCWYSTPTERCGHEQTECAS